MRALLHVHALPIGNRRYGRLETCATALRINLRLKIGLALAQLAVKDCAVAEDNAARNPPLAAVDEEERANDLHENEGD